MDNIFQILFLFGGIGFIAVILILAVYMAIVFINRKMGYDANGNQIKQVHQQNYQNPAPQIIRIETTASVTEEQIQKEPKMFGEKVEDDLPFAIKNIEDVKIETSFENKRIGKIER